MTNKDSTRQLLQRDNLLQEIWTYLPIWFVYLQTVTILNFIMANVPPAQILATGYSRHLFAATAIPPLIWFYAYYRKRLNLSQRDIDKQRVHRWLVAVGFGIPLAIWLLYTIFPFLRAELHADWIRRLFEFMQLIWVAVFMLHILYHGGVNRFVTFFLVAWFYGLLLENSGIILGYFYEPDYLFYLGRLPAPFATMMGWCLVFYCCIWITNYFRSHSPRLRQSVFASALFTTLIALSLDAQIDPLASLSHYFWQWNELLPDWWLNVPFCNYAAWFGAFMAFSLIYFGLFDRDDLNVWQKNTKLFIYTPMICILAGVLWAVLMVIYEGGFDGPTFQIMNHFIDKIVPY